MVEKKFEYKAFISYARDPDKAIAKVLEERIERFGLNWHRLGKQKLFIFRDIAELTPDNDLPNKIESALDNSEFLILLAQDKFGGNDFSWVNTEAEYFVKSCEKRGVNPADYIILVITHGEIEWDRAKNQWNYTVTNVIPKGLRHMFRNEPIYVDLRLLYDESISSSRKKQILQDAVISIVAKLLYKKPSDIQNQIIKLQRYVIGFIAVILILISAISVYAVIQKNSAVQNEAEAKNQAQIAKTNEQEAKKQEKEATKQKNLAIKNEAEAVKQKNIANKNEAEAKRQENLARINEAEAVKQKNIATKNEAEAIRQKNIAKENEELAKFQERRTDTINKLIEAENIALKALDYFKSLNDTLVAGVSATSEVDSLAKIQKNNISEAFTRFNDFGGSEKEEHKNKLETLYTSDVLASVFFARSKTKLNSLYNRVFQTSNGQTVVYNLNGQIFDTKNKQYVFNQDENYVEATPVEGTDFIAYSNYNSNIKLFDIETGKVYQVESAYTIGRDIIADAFKNNENVLMLNSKEGAGYRVEFVESKNSFTPQLVRFHSSQPIQFDQKSYEISYSDDKLTIVKSDSDTISITGVSCYCTNKVGGTVFWGTLNGEVYELRLFGNEYAKQLISVKDRINKIRINENNILAVQVGANQLVLFAKFDWGYTKIYQEIIGRRINDICLGNDGLIYVLYDRNRLVSWPVNSDLFQGKETKLAKR